MSQQDHKSLLLTSDISDGEVSFTSLFKVLSLTISVLVDLVTAKVTSCNSMCSLILCAPQPRGSRPSLSSYNRITGVLFTVHLNKLMLCWFKNSVNNQYFSNMLWATVIWFHTACSGSSFPRQPDTVMLVILLKSC